MSTPAAFGGLVPYVFPRVIFGAGPGASVLLDKLGKLYPKDKLLVLDGGNRWTRAFPRHRPMGQTMQGLTLFPQKQFYQPKARMELDYHQRELADLQQQAVNNFDDDALDCWETSAVSVKSNPSGFQFVCANGQIGVAKEIYFATGVGPERTIPNCGVEILNQISPGRQVQRELTTALQSLQEPPEYFQNKRVVVYGGGATAAWTIENLLAYGVKSIDWISPNGFQNANPNGGNNEVMQATQNSRFQAGITSIRFLGDPARPSDEGMSLSITDSHKVRSVKVDLVIAATGSDPLGATGVKTVLGPLYNELIPCTGQQHGVFGLNKQRTLFVLSPALGTDLNFRNIITGQNSLGLTAENQVIGGVKESFLSAEAVVEELKSKQTFSSSPPSAKNR